MVNAIFIIGYQQYLTYQRNKFLRSGSVWKQASGIARRYMIPQGWSVKYKQVQEEKVGPICCEQDISCCKE